MSIILWLGNHNVFRMVAAATTIVALAALLWTEPTLAFLPASPSSWSFVRRQGPCRRVVEHSFLWSIEKRLPGRRYMSQQAADLEKETSKEGDEQDDNDDDNNNNNNNNNNHQLEESLLSCSTSTSTAEPHLRQQQRQRQRQQQLHEQERPQRCRVLGSQELLMLPRQYGPAQTNKDQDQVVVFPQMTHVCAVVLNATPDETILRQALQEAMAAHPLLNARVQGDGEPDKRIDLMQMVRQGDPNPCTFVVVGGNASSSVSFSVDQVLTVHNGSQDWMQQWQQTFVHDLDDGGESWCHTESGPLWKVEWYRSENTTTADKSSSSSSSSSPCALVFSLNHAISDQSSMNRLVDQILQNVASLEERQTIYPPSTVHVDLPMSVEDSVLGLGQRFRDVGPRALSLRTLSYILGKAGESFQNPVILPDQTQPTTSNPIVGTLQIIAGQTAGGEDQGSNQRQTTVQFRTVDPETTSALLTRCREHGVSMSNALTAAMTLTATDFVGATNDDDNDNDRKKKKKQRNYKVLQSLDMRRFGQQLDQAETVACMAGSHDLMLGPLFDGSGKAIRRQQEQQQSKLFWDLAQESKRQTEQFVQSNGPEEAVRVFDFAMTISDMNNLVHLTSQSKDTQGRAYSAGVTNVGVYERQLGFARNTKNVNNNHNNDRDDQNTRSTLQIQHGRYRVQDVYYATPHVRSGCLYPLSCMTVDGALKMTFHPMSPVVSAETNEQFANAFVELLQVMAQNNNNNNSNKEGLVQQDAANSDMTSMLKHNALPILTAIAGVAAVASHAGAYADFFQAVLEMKEKVPSADFWPALNFWIFFAVGHPILQPILWISDVMHGTPGPKVLGDHLVPVLFLAGNALFIAAFSLSQQIRTAVNIAAVAAFFTYVGAGLDGTAGLGDSNLALDDSYKGQIVKGCPTYDQVRQPSMDNFDLNKYQGLWYEQKFHDWTQFKEVYDTTLKIKLIDDGTGWVDDFAVKGPAPNAAKLSWDKSPVANGAHYFLFGRVDPNDPPGILRESGFGVEFPNYIVDVQTDPKTGEYTESIQFQCLERGGVRVFEGINFMSRNPTMTDAEMDAMHTRAQAAGMYPYGASPEQMHTVARRPVGAPDIDNNWQAMWRAIGFDKLLELLTESIEDGGR